MNHLDFSKTEGLSPSWLARDDRYVWHPFSATPAPGPRALLTRAEGAYVFDDGGNSYLDATSSWWCQIHGHGHPRLVRALSEQAARLDQILMAPHAHPAAVACAEALIHVAGPPFQKVFFSDDGSTAVETGIKMALQYFHNKGEKERTKIVSIEGAYHGDTLGAVSVGFVEEFHGHLKSSLLPSLQSREPYCFRCPLQKTYPSCGLACLDRAQEIFGKHGSEIAVLVVEPLVMGAAGMRMYPKEYLSALCRLARESGALLLFDEVFTGFGRTGTFFAYEQLDGERPDIVALSKGLTSGMLPMGATLATEEIFEAFRGSEEKKFFHGHTFSGNGLGCAVALESLRLFQEEKVLERNQVLSALMREQRPRFAELAHVGEVRHLGMIWAVELVQDRRTKNLPVPPNGPGWKIAARLWEKGMWIRPLSNVIYLVPPYCIRPRELTHCFDLLYEEIQNGLHFS